MFYFCNMALKLWCLKTFPDVLELYFSADKLWLSHICGFSLCQCDWNQLPVCSTSNWIQIRWVMFECVQVVSDQWKQLTTLKTDTHVSSFLQRTIKNQPAASGQMCSTQTKLNVCFPYMSQICSVSHRSKTQKNKEDKHKLQLNDETWTEESQLLNYKELKCCRASESLTLCLFSLYSSVVQFCLWFSPWTLTYRQLLGSNITSWFYKNRLLLITGSVLSDKYAV